MKKKNIFYLLLILFVISCSNTSIENDSLWKKNEEIENLNKLFYPTKVYYEEKVINFSKGNHKKETHIYIIFNVNIKGKNREVKFIEGKINDKKVDENNLEVKKLINAYKTMKKNDYTTSNMKISKTKRVKIINENKCIGYNFQSFVKDNTKKNNENKQRGTIWLDAKNREKYLIEKNVYPSLFSNHFIFTKIKALMLISYNNKLYNEVELKSYIQENFLFIPKINTEVIVKYSNFTKY